MIDLPYFDRSELVLEAQIQVKVFGEWRTATVKAVAAYLRRAEWDILVQVHEYDESGWVRFDPKGFK